MPFLKEDEIETICLKNSYFKGQTDSFKTINRSVKVLLYFCDRIKKQTMGLLDKIFKKDNVQKPVKTDEKENTMNWLVINSMEQIDLIKSISKKETVFVFKHSTRCGISNMVIKQFEKKVLREGLEGKKIFYLDLLAYRNISETLGHTFQVLHQSPQLMAIKNGVSIANASHYSIIEMDLQNL